MKNFIKSIPIFGPVLIWVVDLARLSVLQRNFSEETALLHRLVHDVESLKAEIRSLRLAHPVSYLPSYSPHERPDERMERIEFLLQRVLLETDAGRRTSAG
jgi:hypothetical protein